MSAPATARGVPEECWPEAAHGFPADRLDEFLLWAADRGASDIAFQTGAPAFVEIDGNLQRATAVSLDGMVMGRLTASPAPAAALTVDVRVTQSGGYATAGTRQVILDPGLPAHRVSERQVGAQRPVRIERRGEDEGAARPRLPLQDGAGRRIQEHLSRSGLGVGQIERVCVHVLPSHGHDLALAATSVSSSRRVMAACCARDGRAPA